MLKVVQMSKTCTCKQHLSVKDNEVWQTSNIVYVKKVHNSKNIAYKIMPLALKKEASIPSIALLISIILTEASHH